MRNLHGYLIRTLSKYHNTSTVLLKTLFFLTFLATLLYGPIYPIHLYAQETEETSTSSEAVVDYNILENGDLRVSVSISLSNITDQPLPIKLFETSLPFPNASEIAAKYSNEYLYLTSAQRKENTDISINLENRILRKNSPMNINLYFTIPDFYDPTQPVLTLPSGFSFSNITKINLLYPKSMGLPTSVEPADYVKKDTDEKYWLSFKDMKGVDIYILLSDQLVYRYNQKNQLINSDSVEKIFDIILPPNSSTQTVLLTTIDPKPSLTQIDSEGNVIMQYLLQPSETLDVVIGGFISKHPRNTEEVNASLNPNYSDPSGYWLIEDDYRSGLESEIIEIPDESWSELSKNERDEILLSINKFVVSTLDSSKYDENDIQFRKNASESSEGIDSASPQDYVDLSIALLRMYGIPSRQVIGYSTNLQEIFRSSTTHTWVQYWDPENGWSSMDTYQDEILGTNRINIASADRVALMYRGLDPVFPQYTSYSIEYLTIKLSDEKVTPTTNIALDAQKISWSITDTLVEIPISIKNDGSTMLKKLAILSPTGDLVELIDRVIVPGQELNISIPMQVSAIQSIMEANDDQLSFGIEAESTLGTSTTSLVKVENESSEPWWWAPMITLISLILFMFLVIIGVYAFKLVRHKFR